MTRPPRTSRPGPAHADRRELRLVRTWLETPEIARALCDSIASGDEGARRLRALGRRAGVRLVSWRGYENGDRLVFREQEIEEPLALVIERRGPSVELAPSRDVDAGGEIEVVDLDTAVDAIAAPVLAWLRARGDRPKGASRLAALFEPRRRGTQWPSSPY